MNGPGGSPTTGGGMHGRDGDAIRTHWSYVETGLQGVNMARSSPSRVVQDGELT
jgi:hypothetical protein